MIPVIHVDSRVVSVTAEPRSGAVQVPPDVGTVGWYSFGPAPGAPGSAVLVGHVDSSAQGAGSFFDLQSVPLRAVVIVRMSNGSRRLFRVVARRLYPKTSLPSSIFVRDGTSRLVLVTCGGAFDPVHRHYASNVVVYAAPTASWSGPR
jgi:hypothetical protein